MTFDTSQMRRLSADLSAAPARVAREVQASVFRGAMQIKAQMQDDARKSTHFSSNNGRGLAESISFDTTADRAGFSAEIGPVVGRGQGSLAHIAYFGSSRGGGRTVRDPQEVLDEEAPKFARALGDIVGDVL